MKYLLSLLVIVVSCRNNSRHYLPKEVIANVYLANFDSANLAKDIAALKSIPCVKDVMFVSKEEAKKRYLADGNEDWTAVLDENPLPDSYEVKIDTRKCPESDYRNFSNVVQQKIPNCTDVSMPDYSTIKR